jgi:hypothetical protein
VGRTTGNPGTFGPDTAQGFPFDRQGAPPSGAGAPLGPPVRYILGGAGSVPWVAGPAGTLGETPPMLLGVYDRRPWEGPPGNRDASWWRNGVFPCMGETLSVRVVVEPAFIVHDPAVPLRQAWAGPWSGYALALLVAGWEEGDASVALPAVPMTPSDPFAPGALRWWPSRLCRIGPNLMHALAGAGSAEVDLGAWAGSGSRFAAAWLWAFWVGPTPPPLTVTACALSRPWVEVAPSGPCVVTVPVVNAPDGPLPPSPVADAFGVARAGSFPSRASGGPSRFLWSVVNGNGLPVEVEARSVVGPSFAGGGPFTGGVIRTPALAPGETYVSAGQTGAGGLAFYAAAAAPAGATAGPILISWSGPG